MLNDEQKIKDHFNKIFNTNIDIKLNMLMINYIYNLFLEDLYTPSEKYNIIREEYVDKIEQLIESLDEKQNELFEDILELNTKVTAEEELQLFVFGYLIFKELDNEIKRTE